MSVPGIRIDARNDAPVRPRGKYVLYWMTAFRRTSFNFALQRAVEWSRDLGRPLLVLEALRCGYPWASERLHAFVCHGMRRRRIEGYYPYVEPAPGAGKGLLGALARDACVVVTDDYPCFFLPRMVAAAARLKMRLEAVDGNGLLPMRAADRDYPTAYAFRRFLQRELREHLAAMPVRHPLRGVPGAEIPAAVARRWPPGVPAPEDLAALPLDHDVKAVLWQPPDVGGFVKRLDRYAKLRNEPEEEATSGLSPHLHFGFVSAHEVFSEIARAEEWEMDHLAPQAKGKRAGWWGMSEGAEAFLDQLVTWRELGFNLCAHRPEDYDRYESLPLWARTTLREHEPDPREHVYTLEEFARSETHDPLWNAAQTQLRREGRLHNYLRMLWGKKILEWTPAPRDALAVMIELNNRYALDGRDPNSYSGIFWVLGRYDRAWGPERPVFGKIRYMSSKNTARKVSVRGYLERYGPYCPDS